MSKNTPAQESLQLTTPDGGTTNVEKYLDSTFKCNTPSPYEVLPWNRPEPTPT